MLQFYGALGNHAEEKSNLHYIIPKSNREMACGCFTVHFETMQKKTTLHHKIPIRAGEETESSKVITRVFSLHFFPTIVNGKRF